jgi:hypothetical protein
MPTQEQKIPNRPLNGQELKAVCLKNADDLVQRAREKLAQALGDRIERDSLFAPTYIFPGVKIECSFRFHFRNRNLPKTEAGVVVTAGEGVNGVAGSHFVDGVERSLEIDNPNLTRIDASLPFTEVEVKRAEPGEMFGKIETREIPVSGSYPSPTPPVDTDTTEHAAAELGIAEPQRLRPPKERKSRK